jgi:hypothetical protein
MITHLSFPSARMTGWKNGGDQPTNTAARLGHDVGHNVLPALIVFAFVILFVAKLGRRRGWATGTVPPSQCEISRTTYVNP